jgi:hypothetical protein
VVQKAIEVANLFGRESKEERKRAKEAKVEAKVEAKKRAKERAEEKKVALIGPSSTKAANEQRGWVANTSLLLESAIIGPRKTMAPRAF